MLSSLDTRLNFIPTLIQDLEWTKQDEGCSCQSVVVRKKET
jgi:hypothetical protein